MKRLVRKDFEDDALKLGVDVASVQAVAQVESLGGGFLKGGRPKILFEGHIFWHRLKKAGIIPESYVKGNENILYYNWTKKHYKGGAAEYDRLKQAESMGKGDVFITCALLATSWGMFQIMGFNYKRCGYSSVENYVAQMYVDENTQLETFTKYILNYPKLHAALKRKDWAAFAYRYNGKQYKKNKYDEKLLRAYNKFADIK